MDKDRNYFGIDISKDTIDVYNPSLGYKQYANTYKGFKKFLKQLSQSSICVMEATGYYHQKLAYFLVEESIRVSVENPLKIKRFIQMKLSKVKTDKSDAKQIYEYSLQMNPELWECHTPNQRECLQITRLLSTYIKQSTQLKNKIKGEMAMGSPSKMVLRSLKKQLKSLKSEISKLEEALEEMVKGEHEESLTLLKSIPGIGKKTAIMLLVFTDGFKRFETATELCSYAGITPIIRESGSSIRSRPRISKAGNGKLRNLLFMCSFNACKYNKACKALYDRLVAKGKSKKLALIAVCNKLLKQAFAVVKNKMPYDPNYRSTLT